MPNPHESRFYGSTPTQRNLKPLTTTTPSQLIEDNNGYRYLITTTGAVNLTTLTHQTTIPDPAYEIGILNQLGLCIIGDPPNHQPNH